MRRWIFKWSLAGLLMLVASSLYAQLPDSLPRGKEYRTDPSYEGWSRLIPTHVKGQYAGGLGVASIGLGWDYGRHAQWETDLMAGWLPAEYSDHTRFIFALKQHYIPWQLRLHRRWSVDPLTCGCYFSVITGDNFWIEEPSIYGGSYYRFSSRLRAYIYLGQRLTYHIKRPESTLRSITFFYELSACDLALVSKGTNKSLEWTDVFTFSCGVKFHLFKP